MAKSDPWREAAESYGRLRSDAERADYWGKLTPEQQAALSRELSRGRRTEANRHVGLGCSVQALGLAMLLGGLVWFWPGILVGAVLLALGQSVKYGTVCSRCGNRVERTARLCPTCRAELS